MHHLDRHELKCLTASNALERIAGHRRRELLSARLMAVYGSVEREGEVVHVIARRLADHSELLGRLATSSRDFH
jgi:error-prone DNA polymerase